jgi:predicted PurR-regulated permease PerM
MDDQLRYFKDRATVIAIIKYSLYIAIAATFIYFSTKLIVVIVPFLIGFVLAKASRQIAKGIIRIQNYFYRVTHKSSRKSTPGKVMPEEYPDPSVPEEYVELFDVAASEAPNSPVQTINESGTKAPAKTVKKPSRILTLLFPPKNRRNASRLSKVSMVVYVTLLVLTLAALILAAAALVIQLNRAIINVTNWAKEVDIVSVVSSWISQFSVESGGFLAPDQIDSIKTYLTSLKEPLSAMIPDIIQKTLGVMLSVLGSLPMLLFSIIVIIMSGFYFLSDSKMILKFFSRNITSRFFRHKSILLVDQLSTTLFRVLGGYMLLLMVTFFESMAIFLLAGVSYAVILALITAVLDFMPVLGVSATMVPMMIYLAVQGDYREALIVLIGMVIVTIVRRVIEPPILGNAMHMHPLATLFAMIVGVSLWGPIGFLLGPVVFLILREAFKGFSLDTKIRTFAGNVLNKYTE